MDQVLDPSDPAWAPGVLCQISSLRGVCVGGGVSEQDQVISYQ